jgi:hypothetical protein
MEDRAWKASTQKNRKKFNSSRLVGVEWEYNHCGRTTSYYGYGYSYGVRTRKPLTTWLRKWRGGIHTDGSCGYEVVTPPLAGDYIAPCLKELGKAFVESRAQINSLCSIHVHVSAKDFTWNDMYRLLWVYSRVEEVLFRLAGLKRKRSPYCRPCGAAFQKALACRFIAKNAKVDIREQVLKTVYLESGRTTLTNDYGNPMTGRQYYRRAGRRNQGRYKAINICPWLSARKTAHKKGMTVEFRLHENTNDAERVIQWTKLCVQLVDWVRKADDIKAKRLPENALLALSIMCPKSRKWLLTQANQWKKKVFEL